MTVLTVQGLILLVMSVLLLAMSAVVSWLMLRRVRILDVPGHRSSHAAPTPSSGGIGIVLSYLLAMGAAYLLGETSAMPAAYFPGFLVSALLVAGISLYDDITHQPFHIKLATQFIAVLVLMASGIVIEGIHLPGVGRVELVWGGYALTALWILGLVDAYNFMDGLDGLAGGTAVVVAVVFAAISSWQGEVFVPMICYGLAAGTLGFLLFNFPPARIFMGDVGSAFLGFVFAALAVIAAQVHTPLLVMPLLLFNFIYDTAFTLFRRWRVGEVVTAAHKGHLYQLANQLGYSHRNVSLFHYGVTAAQGIGAVLLVQLDETLQPLVFLPFLAFQILYSSVIIRRAREAGIIR